VNAAAQLGQNSTQAYGQAQTTIAQQPNAVVNGINTGIGAGNMVLSGYNTMMGGKK
jgi:hypothetical protein